MILPPVIKLPHLDWGQQLNSKDRIHYCEVIPAGGGPRGPCCTGSGGLGSGCISEWAQMLRPAGLGADFLALGQGWWLGYR